jgi:hypothetical protein
LKSLIEGKIEQANGDKIKSLTGLEPNEINDAVGFLKEDLNAIEVQYFLGTSPYNFGSIKVNIEVDFYITT